MTQAVTKEPDTLSQLIERLERANGQDRELDFDIALAVGGITEHRSEEKTWFVRDGWHFLCAPNGQRGHFGIKSGEGLDYTGSIDAALKLAPRGSLWSLCDMEEGPFAQVIRPMPGGGYVGGLTTGKGLTPAIALCIAALRARQAPSNA